MNHKAASVIIPAYNAGFSLNACIESVLLQSQPALETIVINDGSIDHTAQIAKSYGDKIIYIEQSNQGQGAARNAGLEKATGEFVAFLDADDYWKPGFLENCLVFLEEYPEAIAVSTAFIVRYVDGTEKTLPKALHGPDRVTMPLLLDNFFSFWAEQDHVRTGTALVRKSVIDQAGGQRTDLRISQDLEYWAYLATFGKWGFIPLPLWVGNSRAIAAPGWFNKYQLRRRLCPNVESWQERILPRLTEEQTPSFEKVRGRVAANFMHTKILTNNDQEAYRIYQKYQADMPRNRLTQFLRIGACGGRFTWSVVCRIVRLRENLKSHLLSLKS
jgi:hypothetical protein